VQDPALTADELFRLLTRTELVELLGGAYDAQRIVGAAKASQCKVIREHWPDPGTLAQWQARGCAPAGDERAVAACPTSNAAARIGAGVPPHSHPELFQTPSIASHCWHCAIACA